jgi:putative chitinase
MNLTKLFTTLRSLDTNGKLEQRQVDSVNAIVQACSCANVTDPRHVAYILATAWHESRLKPIEEIGKGAGRDYGKKLKMSRLPYTKPDKIYYGRGFVQLTWYENYQLMGRLIGVDLLNRPELALSIDHAAEIIVEGMTKGASSFGDFTGKCVEMYFNDKVNDPINARKVVNGLDKAELIAGYYSKILTALNS